MKFSATWIMIAVLALCAGCAINHRSGDYACGSQSDCNSGRECINGFCIVPGSIDASADGCPSRCSSCNLATHTCSIDCAVTSCAAKVACPVGWACAVKCNVDGACSNGVSCAGTTSCSVDCSAKNTCSDVACSTGKCAVNCAGERSCRAVKCNSSCACDVKCSGARSCDALQCYPAQCTTAQPAGCTALSINCHTC